MKQANPQGKGNLPVLAELSGLRGALASVPAKPVTQVATELFTALFVLEADFRFRPVPGRHYYLYQRDDAMSLSMVSPQEWGRLTPGRFLGTCCLHADMTWSLSLSDEASADEQFQQRVAARQAAFEQALQAAPSLGELLPFHLSRRPFAQRALGFALAHSLGMSMERAGIRELDYGQALAALPDARSA